MKKRVISLILVAMMLFTLVPFSAFAANTITITKQPVDVTVSEGQTATFTIDAKYSGSKTPTFVWVDADKVNLDNISDFSSFLSTLGDAKLGEGKTLKLTNVTEDMDGMTLACIVYATQLAWPPFVFEVSDNVTLHVNAVECDSHSLDDNLEYVPAKEPTCAEEGNIAYYYCTVCNRYYLDENGTVQTTLDKCMLPKSSTHGTIVLVPAVAGTCCDYGHISYYECEVCGQMFEDYEATKPLTDRDVRTDKVPANHTNLQHFDAVAATCCEEGNIEYWYCDGCKDYFTDPEGKNEIAHAKLDTDRDPYNHTNLVEYPAKAATCEAPGNIRYWYCDGCKDYFADPAGHSEISKSDTVLAQLEHTYKWFAMEDQGVEWHEYRCEECGTIKESGSHKGGEAGCCEKAVCDVCGFEYGEINPENHKNIERQILVEATPEKDGLCNIICLDCGKMVEQHVPYAYKDTCIHSLALVEEIPAKCVDCEDAYGVAKHYVCEKCGTMFFDEKGEEEVTDMDELKLEPHEHFIKIELFGNTEVIANMAVQQYGYDATGHWKECKYCGYTYTDSFQTHTILQNAEPTCCTGHSCLICGYDDGERNPDNHIGGTELRGVCEPVDGKPGYTGDEVCLGCEAVLKKGWEYYPACGDCANHLEKIEAIPSTCTQDGILEHWKCTVCGNIYMDAKATVPGDNNSIIDKCTGHELHPGENLLSAVDVSSLLRIMGWSWNDLLDIIEGGNLSDIKKISIDDFLDQITIKDIDHCHDDEYHWLGCQKCGKSLADIREDLEGEGIFISEKWYELSEKTAHSGGVADCSHKAICDVCGEEYGELGEHRYNKVGKDATCTEPGYIKYVCTGCGAEDTERCETFPALGHHFEKGQCTRCPERIRNPFVDVSNSDQFYTAIMWAYTYEPQITAGHRAYPGSTDLAYFDPQDPCTRGQVVTFLWRAAGKPEPATTVNPFSDVSNSGPCAPFYTAILWAAEQGITTGYNDGTFKPNKTVSRAEFVTFLWRYFDKPVPGATIYGFADANSIAAPFRDAVAWAVEKGITTGYQDNTFRPNVTCNRWQVVMFMYRAIGEGKAY